MGPPFSVPFPPRYSGRTGLSRYQKCLVRLIPCDREKSVSINEPKLLSLVRPLSWSRALLISITVFLLGLTLLHADHSYAQVGGGLEGSVVALAIDPQTPTTLYAGTGGGVYKSTDSGKQWTAINTGLSDRNVEVVAIDPHTPTILYAGTYGGVFKSIDGGGSWTPINTDLPANTHPYTLVIDPLTTTTLYMGSGDGVFKSSNGGQHWEAISSGLTDIKTTALSINPMTPTILYVGTLDRGVFQRTAGGKYHPQCPSVEHCQMIPSSGTIFRCRSLCSPRTQKSHVHWPSRKSFSTCRWNLQMLKRQPKNDCNLFVRHKSQMKSIGSGRIPKQMVIPVTFSSSKKQTGTRCSDLLAAKDYRPSGTLGGVLRHGVLVLNSAESGDLLVVLKIVDGEEQHLVFYNQ